MTARVGLLGTFEVSNYGDLLFPLIAHSEIAHRRPDVEFIWLGPIGAASATWPTVVGLGPVRPERAEVVAGMCDALVCGGGDLIRDSDVAVGPSYGLTEADAQVWRPSGWFSSLGMMSSLGAVVLWNGVGVAEPVDGRAVTHGASYLSVRDRRSVAHLGDLTEQVEVVPDTVFLLDRLFPRDRLDSVFQELVGRVGIPESDYIVLQASSSVADMLDFEEIDRVAGKRRIVSVQIGPCHGDARAVGLARKHFGSRLTELPIPAHLEDIAAVICNADFFLGNSLHGGITSLVYETPFALFQFDAFSKREAVLEVAGVDSRPLVRDPRSIPTSVLSDSADWDRDRVVSTLDRHFDQLTGLIPADSRATDLGWHEHPDLLHLALERLPSPLVFGTQLEFAPIQPPEPPPDVGGMLSLLRSAKAERDELADPALPLLRELGRTRNTSDDYEQAFQAARALRELHHAAEMGWSEAVDRVGLMEEGLAAAETGWSEAVEQVAFLEGRVRSLEGLLSRVTKDLDYRTQVGERLEAQIIERSACWRDHVAGPPVGAAPVSPAYSEQYDGWMARTQSHSPVPSPPTETHTFSILTPVFNPPPHLLENCIRSVRSQTYGRWEMILMNISDAPHVDPICRRYSQLDPRIRIVTGPNLGISANTNVAASEAVGDWFVLLDHDDELAPHALASIAEALQGRDDVAFVYSDEDKIDESGRRSDPFFKPDWSPDLLRTVNYITHLQAVRRDLWERLGGLRPAYDGAQDYDLALRAGFEAGGALHIPDVLYHWRVHDESTAGDVGVKPYAHRAGRRALEDFVRNHAEGAVVEFGPGPTSHRVRYPVHSQSLSVIIPFKDRWDLTDACLTAIARTGTALPLEVLLIDNRSSDPVTHAKVLEWRERFEWVRALDYDEPFNFQKMNNWAVEQATGELLLFLNNDVEPIHEGWVEAMAEHAQRPEIGAVGARLFYPNGLVQHAGVFVGIGGYADHPWARLHPDTWTPAGPSYWTRNFLAVSAACLMVEREKFESVGGFDERFTIGGGDVALGLALHQAGYWNVMTPFARLVHHESVSRGTVVPDSDLRISEEVYGPIIQVGDPFANPNLALTDTSCSLR